MRLVIYCLLLLSLTSDLIAQEIRSDQTAGWPRWRGPDWHGVAANSNPPIEFSESKNLQWKTRLEGNGHGTPIVWNNRIFLQSAIPVERDLPVPDVIPEGTPNTQVNPNESIVRWKPQQFVVVCLDRETGKLIWKRVVHEAMPHQGHHFKGSFASQSMVTDGTHVFAYFGSYGLYCFDFDGNLIWQHDPQPQAMEAGLGEGSSPALCKHFLVIVVDQETQSYIAAFNKRTGKQIWKQDRDEPSNWSTPRILEFRGRNQVVVNGIAVRSYDLETGKLIWKCGGHTASAVPVPAVGHGLVFNTSGWSRDKLQAIQLGHQGDLTDTDHITWGLDRGTPYVPSPMLWGSELYLLDDRNFFSCFNAIDGDQHYRIRLPVPASFSASPVGGRDRIYLASEEGNVFVVRRGAKYELLNSNKLEDSFLASPVIVGRQILLRGKHDLYCFSEQD